MTARTANLTPHGAKPSQDPGDDARDRAGRFGKGNKVAKGRTHKRQRMLGNAITMALQEIVDPEEVAQFLYDTMNDPDVEIRERTRAAREIYDRCEGTPVSRQIRASMTSSALPEAWEALTPSARGRWLADQRARALAGEVPELAPTQEDNNE